MVAPSIFHVVVGLRSSVHAIHVRRVFVLLQICDGEVEFGVVSSLVATKQNDVMIFVFGRRLGSVNLQITNCLF